MEDSRRWVNEVRKLSLVKEPPVRQKAGAWEVVDRKGTWKLVAPAIFEEHLEKLRSVAVEVLTERDPQFDLEPEKRYAAAIYKKVLSHSRQLRQGIAETLALIGSDPKALSSSGINEASAVPVLVVRTILKDADWLLWASLNDCLPTLAEAAPTEFLDAVESSLEKTPSPFIQVFAQESSGIMGRNYMTGLLWALEALAWHPDHIGRATLVLGGLAKLDPGGNWANRPANSLTEIFLPWYRQTTASPDAQVAAVSALQKEQPDVAWRLILSLLPNATRSSSTTHKPNWRDWVPNEWTPKQSDEEYLRLIDAYAKLALAAVSDNNSRLVQLIERIPNLPKSIFDQFLDILTSKKIIALAEIERRPLWEALTGVVNKHRKFPDADWAMPNDIVEKIASVAAGLAPTSPELLNRRLFSNREWDLYNPKADHESERQRIDLLRQQVVQELLNSGGLESIKTLAKGVEKPGLVGVALGKIAEPDLDSVLLPNELNDEDKSLRELGRGFVFGRFLARDWSWVDDMLRKEWPTERKADLLVILPFEKAVWDRVTPVLGPKEGLYWRQTNALTAGTTPDVLAAVEKLLLYGRPYTAIECLGRMHFNRVPLPISVVIRALEAALTSKEPQGALDFSNIEELLVWLQQQPDADPAKVAQLEWNYLPAMGHHGLAKPQLLERRMATEPSFFCEVIRAVFRSKKEGEKKSEPTEHEGNVASNAYRLLQEWRNVPGNDENSNFNPDVFNKWLADVRGLSAASGHLEITLHMFGQVLAFSPPDPSGLWLHRTVAEALEAKDGEEMRSGFTNRLFNMRGVHGFTAGKAEKDLAIGYRTKADALDQAGFPRAASALRSLAETYERIAEEESKRDPHRE